MDDTGIELFCNRMARMIDGLTLKVTREDSSKSITYLDMMLTRNTDGSITRSWWQKECSNGTIINFLSSHPTKMKESIVTQYVKHALSITSSEAYKSTLQRLAKVLRKSSYPHQYIKFIIWHVLNNIGNLHITSSFGITDNINIEFEVKRHQTRTQRTAYTINTANKTNKTNKTNISQNDKKAKRYIGCPFYTDAVHSAFHLFLRNINLDVTLAPRPMITNSTMRIYSSLKHNGPDHTRKYAVYKVKCSTCSRVLIISTGNLDLDRSTDNIFRANEVMNHLRENPAHLIDQRIFDVVSFKTAREMNRKCRLLKDARNGS